MEERCVHAQIDMDGWIDGRMQGGRGRERGWKREKMEERCAHTRTEREREHLTDHCLTTRPQSVVSDMIYGQRCVESREASESPAGLLHKLSSFCMMASLYLFMCGTGPQPALTPQVPLAQGTCPQQVPARELSLIYLYKWTYFLGKDCITCLKVSMPVLMYGLKGIFCSLLYLLYVLCVS